MRLVLQRGDALMWPNVDWETGQAVEDIRTLRIHLRDENGTAPPAIGLDAFFHDNPLREQQLQRNFVPDGDPRVGSAGVCRQAHCPEAPVLGVGR
mmetsp:Transcript_106788/g.297249  ORF Transcript_106788/g.297249 Transcript_106788/m.297249 type:complete len:95 (-) Transcript_106788:154-438(-)